MSDVHGLSTTALKEYVDLLCNIRGTSFTELARVAGKRTNNMSKSLEADNVNARIRYIPHIVAALDLTRTEARTAYEYAGVVLLPHCDLESVECYWQVRHVMDKYADTDLDAEYEEAVNAVLRRYDLPTIAITTSQSV